jgi:hypothetical protein
MYLDTPNTVWHPCCGGAAGRGRLGRAAESRWRAQLLAGARLGERGFPSSGGPGPPWISGVSIHNLEFGCASAPERPPGPPDIGTCNA